MTTDDNSTLSQYVIVRINQDANEAPFDITRFVADALSTAAFFRDDLRVLAHEVEEPVWEAARRGATRSDKSADDFVSVEDDSGRYSLNVWSQEGSCVIVHTDPRRTSLERIAHGIKDALRTWDGWK